MCVKELHDTLSKNFILYQKAHHYHWNVIGPDFIQFHSFFGSIYSDVYDQIDVIAEHIRALDSLVDFSGDKVAVIKSTKASDMVVDLLSANDALVVSLKASFAAAEKTNDQGLMNYLADRIDAHAKHRWQLSSVAGRAPTTSVKESVEDIVDVNGHKVIRRDGMYWGLMTESGPILSDEGKYTLSELVDVLSAKGK